MAESISENGYNYLSIGHGRPILILHGLMGGLSNFDGVFNYFPKYGYRVIAPELPVYNSSILDTNVKFFAKFIHKFIKFKNLKDVVILGNSLGGHVGLIFSKLYPKLIKGLVLRVALFVNGKKHTRWLRPTKHSPTIATDLQST